MDRQLESYRFCQMACKNGVSTMNKKIYFAGPSISDQDIETVLDACKNGWYDRMAYHVTGLEE
jgi:hypothetical protein